MKNKKYFLSRVNSTEEYDGIYFCYVEVENLEKFREDLKKMQKAFSIAQAITPISSIDFPEPYSVRTFYLNSDDNDFLEDLFEKLQEDQDQGFIELNEPISEDFLKENEGEAVISDFLIRFFDKNHAIFVGGYKHFNGEVQTDSICQSLMPDIRSNDGAKKGDFKFTCSVCGSENVSGKCWADPNTDEIIDYVSNEENDNFCEDCGKAVDLTILENNSCKFLQKQPFGI